MCVCTERENINFWLNPGEWNVYMFLLFFPFVYRFHIYQNKTLGVKHYSQNFKKNNQNVRAQSIELMR